MSDVTVKDMEDRIEKLQKQVKLKDMALKLEKNPEFQKLILEQFCVNECARYAQLSGDPSLKPDSRADSLSLAQSAGHLRRWLSVTVRQGLQAEHDIAQHREAIEELNAEAQS